MSSFENKIMSRNLIKYLSWEAYLVYGPFKEYHKNIAIYKMKQPKK